MPAILDALAAWQNSTTFDVKATANFVSGLTGTIVAFIYSAPAAQRPAAFAAFDAVLPLGAVILPPTNGTVLGFVELTNAQNPVVPGGR